MLGFDLLNGGPGAVLRSFTGMVAAHAYYYLSVVRPPASSGASLPEQAADSPKLFFSKLAHARPADRSGPLPVVHHPLDSCALFSPRPNYSSTSSATDPLSLPRLPHLPPLLGDLGSSLVVAGVLPDRGWERELLRRRPLRPAAAAEARRPRRRRREGLRACEWERRRLDGRRRRGRRSIGGGGDNASERIERERGGLRSVAGSKFFPRSVFFLENPYARVDPPKTCVLGMRRERERASREESQSMEGWIDLRNIMYFSLPTDSSSTKSLSLHAGQGSTTRDRIRTRSRAE